MDRIIEQKKGLKKKHIPYILGGAAALFFLGWLILGDHSSTLRVEQRTVSIETVQNGLFNDYIRLNGQVQPINVIQLSAIEGGMVDTKLIEEGAMVRQGDVIVRLTNPMLSLQILDSEAQLAEKQNWLRNTLVDMELESYFAGLEPARQKLERLLREAFIQTAEDVGLDQRERLYTAPNPTLEPTERRSRLMNFFSPDAETPTPAGIVKALGALGLDWELDEDIPNQTATLEGIPAGINPEELSAIIGAAKQILPAQMRLRVDLNAPDWDYLDGLGYGFSRWDSLDIPWEIWADAESS